MKHAIRSDVRLASPMARLFYKVFGPKNPRGWADYHIVPEKHGTFWIHSHGLASRTGVDLEFVNVPPALRDDALALLLALAATGRSRSRLQAGADFAADLSACRQDFMHVGSLRLTARNDKAHKGMVRIVDLGQPLNSGFPRRLFAAHLTARADCAETHSERMALLRAALKIFPGDYADAADGADFEPGPSSLTGLQNKSSLGAYLGLAQALRDQGRFNEACGYLADAIARCPGWARAYRKHVMTDYANNDAWARFWRDVDIAGTALRHRQAAAGGATGQVSLRSPAGGASGFGARAPDPYEDLIPRR